LARGQAAAGGAPGFWPARHVDVLHLQVREGRSLVMAGYPHLSEVLPQLATAEEIAPLLGLSPLGVARQCRKGKLPALKVGCRWYVHVAKLAAQLDREADRSQIA
jgi:hypothetical protein